MKALPATIQREFTRADLSNDMRKFLQRMDAEMFDFDDRLPMYKPHWQITEIGEALLLHRDIERLNKPCANPIVVNVPPVTNWEDA